MNVVTRGIRNAFRNATRTISIVVILGLSIGLSLVMLIAHQAVENKIKTTLSAIGNTVSISPAGYSGFSEVNNALASKQLKKVQKLAHVTSVVEMLTDNLETTGTTDAPTLPGGAKGGVGGSSSSAKTSLKSITKLNCGGDSCSSDSGNSGMHISVVGGGVGAGATIPSNFSLPVSIVGSNYPTDPMTIGANTLKITSGKAISGTSDDDDAMLSTAMAKKNDLKVGSTFTAYDKTLTVAALFTSNTNDGTIIISLPTEQALSDQSGDVTNATATVDSLTNLSSTTLAIKKALGSSADVTSNITQANDALQPLNTVKNVSMYSLIGSVAAGAVIILLVMVMIVRERKREIGVLKAIGGSNIRIMLQFMSEALTLTILATIIGLGIGIIGGSPVTSTLVSNSSNSSNSTPGGLPSPTTGGGAVSSSKLGFGNVNVGDITNVHAQIGYTIILYGLGAAVLIALIGSALASFFISKVRPSEVLRSE
jgi:putative ABC transport system permease protein